MSFTKARAMADHFWKSIPAALKKPSFDELYRRLRDLDRCQVDERVVVMLNAILQLESKGGRQRIGDRGSVDGGLYLGRDLEPRTDKVAVADNR